MVRLCRAVQKSASSNFDEMGLSSDVGLKNGILTVSCFVSYHHVKVDLLKETNKPARFGSKWYSHTLCSSVSIKVQTMWHQVPFYKGCSVTSKVYVTFKNRESSPNSTDRCSNHCDEPLFKHVFRFSLSLPGKLVLTASQITNWDQKLFSLQDLQVGFVSKIHIWESNIISKQS